MTSPNDETKAQLRFEARRRRVAFVESLSVAARQELEEALVAVLTPLIKQARVVAGYHAHGSEIGLRYALRMAGNNRVEVVLPAFVTADSPMVFRSGAETEVGPHGIHQPPHQAKEVEPDLVLVPLLAVDGTGTRLGQGGGHYDRVLGALIAKGATVIGVGWPMQRIEFPLPRDSWDVALHGFASPHGLELFA
ncbi:MAG: 5-formyltetrahydrofolate cyclo-ligase [Sphingomicrobium sp.]